MAQPVIPSGAGDRPNWAIELYECGSLGPCCYTFWCPCMALASTRTQLDGSDWWVNCCCISAAALRFMVRTGYGIDGTAQWDACCGTFCGCCVINQAYQTVQARGRIPVQNVGPEFNTNDHAGFSKRAWSGIFYDLLYTLLCMPCAIGYTVESAGMPCWFGSCCVSSIGAVNINRYRRRLKPKIVNECCEDCLCPGVLVIGSSFVIGALAEYLELPFIYRAMVEENVAVQRPNCCYGLNIFAACGCCLQYLTNGCVCPVKEGRYLIEDA